jgi:hypothetical protein
MPNAVWPSSLPQFVEIDGYDETLPDALLRTRMDAGPAKQRRRFTAAPRSLAAVTDLMTAAQGATFEAFFETTLQMGALPFDWAHPRTQATKTFRFREPPKAIARPGGRVQYRLSLEIMP